jgi:integrase
MRDSEMVGATVKRHGRLWYFSIAGGKTKAARRNIPMHPVLIRLGIAKRWPLGLTARVVSKRFTRLKRDRGINDPRKTLHSLRKNFTKALEDAGVSTNLAAALLGHSRGFSFDVYNPAGPEFKNLAAAVATVSYPGLKL